MEHTRKLALVDPRQLEYDYLQQQQQQQHRHVEYRDIQKVPDIRVKSDLSLHTKRILDDHSISDDVKAKLYRQTLDRYLKVTNTLPESLSDPSIVINPLHLPPIRRQPSLSPDEGRKKTKKKQKTAAKEQQKQYQQQQQHVKQRKKQKHKTSPSPSPTRVLPRRSERLGRKWLTY